jgi:tetratricopeptide (TPR) repeat protein
MKKLGVTLAILGLFGAAAPLHAADVLKKISTNTTINGRFTSLGKTEVTIEKTSGASETVPVNDIDWLSFDGEPTILKTIRTQSINGSYGAALTSLGKIDLDSATRPEVKQELMYLRAFCHARQGMENGDNKEMQTAGTEMLAFVKESPTSYRSLPANELLGDLLVALNNPAKAEDFYKELAQAPFPEYKMRAGVAIGEAQVQQKKFTVALLSFEAVLQLAAQDKTGAGESEKLAATLGKALCLANDGKPDDGIKLVDEVINDLASDESALLAQAYVTLGECYLKKPDQQTQARLAFLHVDVLYPTQVKAERQALEHLAVLWAQANKKDRAEDAKQRAAQLMAGGQTAAAAE